MTRRYLQRRTPPPCGPVGDTIYAGTVNVEGALQARVLGDYSDSRLAALQRSVELAQTEKPQLAKLADRIASWFVAGILLVTAVTAAVLEPTRPGPGFLGNPVSSGYQLPLRPGPGNAGGSDQCRQRPANDRCHRAWRECTGVPVTHHAPAVRQDRHTDRGRAGHRSISDPWATSALRKYWPSGPPCSIFLPTL